MTPPRILIIDDQFARAADLREELCDRLDIVEIALSTPDSDLPGLVGDHLAAAVFCSGQIWRDNTRRNSVVTVHDIISSGWPSVAGWRWALILLDVQFDSHPIQTGDEQFGMQVLESLVEKWPDPDAARGNSELPVVMLSSMSRRARGAQANRAGARQYLEKATLDRDKLLDSILRHALITDYRPLGRAPEAMLLGRSLPFLKMLRQARQIARIGGRGNALITGPQGTGKTALAGYIHSHSKGAGRSGPLMHYFVTPATAQMEYAALFGAWEGAFTDQRKDSYAGLAEQAHRGTLLIDEVHCLEASNQAELLEFGRLDPSRRRWVTRLGKTIPRRPRDVARRAEQSVLGQLDSSSSKIEVSILLLTATSEPLSDADWREKASFSEPLYTRLAEEYAAGPLIVPGLSDRAEDIPLLFERFLKRTTEDVGGVWPKAVDPEVYEVLTTHSWRANVAELQGVSHFVAQSALDFDLVLPRHLPARLHGRSAVTSTSGDDRRLTLVELNRLVETVKLDATSNLAGALTRFRGASAQLIESLLKAALHATRDDSGRVRNEALGSLVPTRAIRLLTGADKLSAANAASELLRLAKQLEEPPAEDSPLGRAFEWARKRRR